MARHVFNGGQEIGAVHLPLVLVGMEGVSAILTFEWEMMLCRNESNT